MIPWALHSSIPGLEEVWLFKALVFDLQPQVNHCSHSHLGWLCKHSSHWILLKPLLLLPEPTHQLCHPSILPLRLTLLPRSCQCSWTRRDARLPYQHWGTLSELDQWHCDRSLWRCRRGIQLLAQCLALRQASVHSLNLLLMLAHMRPQPILVIRGSECSA